MRTVRTDCGHYRGDRPCAPHKRDGVVCEGCGQFMAAGPSVLIVKLDAMGDVLRTTCILEPLARAWGLPRITWVTRPDSVPLLERNPYVSRVIATGSEALTVLEAERFARVVCLDASRDAASLASIALERARASGQAAEAIGFRLRDGVVVPADARAEAWWQLGLWDDLKKANRVTYQRHMMGMLGLEGEPGGYVLELTEAELAEGDRALRSAGLGEGHPFLALNVGGGGRWEFKRWTEPHMRAFCKEAPRRFGTRVALFGGEAERDLLNRLLADTGGEAFFPGVHPVRRFAAMLDRARALVTSDSLAMHLSLARRRPTVVLFGPTSAAEIETYGLGTKLAPDIECLCCYLPRCDRTPYCQELIEPPVVLEALAGLLERSSP